MTCWEDEFTVGYWVSIGKIKSFERKIKHNFLEVDKIPRILQKTQAKILNRSKAMAIQSAAIFFSKKP